jgi:ABC-type amino acid transport substrate-binding protein
MRSTWKNIVAVIAAGAATAALVACGSPSGNSANTLRVGTLTDAPPAIYLQNGTFTGFDNELLRNIAKKEGFEVQFIGTEFSGLLANVANGQFDIGSSTISTPEARKRTVAFSNGYSTGFTTIITKGRWPERSRRVPWQAARRGPGICAGRLRDQQGLGRERRPLPRLERRFRATAERQPGRVGRAQGHRAEVHRAEPGGAAGLRLHRRDQGHPGRVRRAQGQRTC